MPAFQSRAVPRVAVAVQVPVEVTTRCSGKMLMFESATDPVVPADVSADQLVPGVKPVAGGPSTAAAPKSSSFGTVVAAVAPVVTAATIPVPVAVVSRGEAPSRPVN